jgi:hypothetical protein
VTQAVWAKYVAVPKGCEGLQDESGRLWDIVYMLRCAIRGAIPADWLDPTTLRYQLHVVRTAHDLDRTPPLVTLKATCGPGDSTEPVITILLPDED